jgi:membrane-anchored mycosin MYCP
MIRTGLRMVASGSTALLLMSPSAWAVTPPSVDPEVMPPAGGAGPLVAMMQRTGCMNTGVIPDTSTDATTPSQQMLDLALHHQVAANV